MEMTWSRWFRCESSFGLLLVPNQPGVFALAEEVGPEAGPHARRMLAVVGVEEAEDLARDMSRLFAAGSPWRERLLESRYYVRYAVAPGIADRRVAVAALKNWLNSQREVASHIFEEHAPAPPEYLRIDYAPGAWSEDLQDSPELKTVAESAVDRVTRGMRLSKNVPVEV